MRQYLITLTDSDSDFTFVRQALATIGQRTLKRETLRTIEFAVETSNREKPIFVAQAVVQAMLDNRFVNMVEYKDTGDTDYTALTVGGGISPNIRHRIGDSTPNL